jgi:hypothetical protein
MGKYEGGEFNDPVVRCTDCQRIIFLEDLKKLGVCVCGCRKVRNVVTINDSDLKLLQNKKVDPEFISLFEQVADA